MTIIERLSTVANSPRVFHSDTDSLRAAWADVALVQQAADVIDGGYRGKIVVDLLCGAILLEVV
jgi:hypothetical protein